MSSHPPLAPEPRKRELQVLDLSAAGMSDSEIAFHLHLSPNTIKTYVKRLYQRLRDEGFEVNNRAAAVHAGHLTGWLSTKHIHSAPAHRSKHTGHCTLTLTP